MTIPLTLLFFTSAVIHVKSEALTACKDDYYLNGVGNCVRCSRCSRKQELLQKCTELTDTICLCPEGTYHHLGTLSCKPCDVCGVGFIRRVSCNASKNTVCKRCAFGSTSTGNNSWSCFSTNDGTNSVSARHHLNLVVSICSLTLSLLVLSLW